TRCLSDWSSDVCSSDLGTSAFANSGRLTVGAGSAWTTPAQFTNNGTSTVGGSLSTVKTTNDGVMIVSGTHGVSTDLVVGSTRARSEERRVGKEGRPGRA